MTATVASVEPPIDAHSALASTRVGRVAIVLGLAVMVVWLVGPNIPAGPFRDDVDVLWAPATELGLVQDWGVFSPNPRDQSLDVRARLEFDDGSVETWDVPDFDPVFGAYRQYRWNKWQERIRLDDRQSSWAPTAEWIARQHRRDGVLPRRVVLVRRWIDHEPVGTPTPIDGDWNEYDFFTWERAS